MNSTIKEKLTDMILKNTKVFVQNSENFHQNYNRINKSFYKKQLPLLTHSKISKINSNFQKVTEENKEQKNKVSLKKKLVFPIKNMNYSNFEIKNKKSILFYKKKNTENYFELPKHLTRHQSLNKLNFPNLLISIPIKLKKSNSNASINFFEDYEKDFFSEIDYSNLEYNEFEIFKNKRLYQKIINDRINYFKKTKNDNQTIVLEKNFFLKKQINLKLNSLTITFEDMALPPELQNNKLKINWPFALLPLFYYKGIHTFQKLLSAVIKVENGFDSISFDEEALYVALNQIKDFQNEENKENNNIEIIHNNNDTIDLLTGEKKNECPISLRPAVLKRNNSFLRFNYFIFFWTTNTKVYVTKITLPCISLKIVENNILIQQFIDFELLFFLYKRNFLNWDFYIIKYLSSFTKFREIFQKLGSLNQVKFTQFFLKEPKTKINTFFEEVLYNVYSDQFNRNQILLFKSFYIIIKYLDTNYDCEKDYHIYFTFYQYVKLYQIEKYSNKIPFLIKFLEINNETHTLNFNYEKYDEFDIDVWLNNMKTFSIKSLSNETKEEQLYREFDLYTKKVHIEFKKPEWSIIKFESDKEIIKTWEIGKELEIELVDSILYGSSKSWTKMLNECLRKVNEPVPIFINSLSNLNIKKRNNRGIKSSHSNSSSSDTIKKSKRNYFKRKKHH